MQEGMEMKEPFCEKASPKRCPNGCGNLIEFEKALLVAPTDDAFVTIEQHDLRLFIEAEERKCYYQAILRACQKCGYYEAIEITEEQFSEHCHAKPKVT